MCTHQNLAFLHVALLLGGFLTLSTAGDAMAKGFREQQQGFPRVRAAFAQHLDSVEVAFEKANASWPPSGLFLRVHKLEDQLELWADKRGGKGERVLVKSFVVCAKSGELGPKSVSGDLQVPEGFYRVDRFNPRSSYHLSLGIDYPNAVDKARADGRPPGGDIFIHGNCVTIGCLPIEDEPMEWLYVAAVLARNAGEAVDVHVFPCRFGSKDCEAALTSADVDAGTRAFWEGLRPAFFAFETTRVVPKVTATSKGYRM